MKHFLRIFEYIWPQRKSVVVIVATVVLISILFAFSYATISPLLTVMMGSEGIHGWMDRKICQHRYDMKFYVPDSVDIINSSDSSAAYRLRITSIDEKSSAYQAGLRKEDWIIDIDGVSVNKQGKASIPLLLDVLATVPENEIVKIRYNRINDEGVVEKLPLEFKAAKKPFYANLAQKALSYVPRDESRKDKLNAILFIIIVMMFVTFIRCICKYVHDYLLQKVVDVSLTNMRNNMFSRALNMEVGFFSSEGASDTVSRMIRDTDATGRGIKLVFGKALLEPAKALGLLVFALISAPKITLIFVSCAPAMFWVIAKLGKKMSKATRRSLESWSVMLAKLEESIAALRIVKVYGRQDHERERFRSVNQTLLKYYLKIAKVDALTPQLLEILGMIGGSIGIMFGAYWVFSGEIDAPQFLTLMIILGTIAESFRKTSDVWNKVKQADAAAERVYKVLDQGTEYEADNAVELSPIRNKIVFNNINFTYPGNETPSLKSVNLTIRAGEKVALVGPNGSGKTTLASLLPRFYNPDNGTITFDGVDIKQATLASVRAQIGLVTQNTMTFKDTIANNIGYGKLGATREEIIDAAKRAYAHDFIKQLPKGYDSIIGEASSGFSGGQLQRIAIARAIVSNPAILIFDEATSQVDAESETKIHIAIEDLMQGRTSIIIAHRFSTILKADTIAVFDEGKIRAIGTHEELVKSCPLYNALYETQIIK